MVHFAGLSLTALTNIRTVLFESMAVAERYNLIGLLRLRKVIEKIVPEYNNRPHGSLSGLTPTEVYNGDAIYIDKNFADARQKRKQYNEVHCCKKAA
jgi:hypothetical protein